MKEAGEAAFRAETREQLSKELRESMKEFEKEGGISHERLTLELATNIRQLLAFLHEDGDWTDRDLQEIETERAFGDAGVEIGGAVPKPETEVSFSGNDKYGLVYAPSEVSGWYVTLYNVYLNSPKHEAKMRAIVSAIEEAGLPLTPAIQEWMKSQK